MLRVLAALAFVAAGCLEATPPPVKGIGDGGVQPQPDAGAGGDARDPSDGGPSDVDPDASVPDAGAAAWAGTWVFTSGSQGILCGNDLSVIAVDGFLDITPSASGTLLTVQEDSCTFHFDLAGNVATEEPGQACAAWAVPMIPDWTLTMQPDGTLREKIGGTVAVGGELCMISGGSTLVRQ